MSISSADVKKLRDMTGAGMMDAKEALQEAKGDVDKALEVLRKKGQKIAAKKSSREVKEGVVGVYLHSNGKVAAMVELFCETDFVARTEKFKDLANELAMQIAAMSPQYLDPESVPADLVFKEKEIYLAELKDSEKPEAVKEKIVAGKLEKFYSQICLVKQPYIKDDSLTIEKLLTAKVAQIGENIKIGNFSRLAI